MVVGKELNELIKNEFKDLFKEFTFGGVGEIFQKFLQNSKKNSKSPNAPENELDEDILENEDENDITDKDDQEDEIEILADDEDILNVKYFLNIYFIKILSLHYF